MSLSDLLNNKNMQWLKPVWAFIGIIAILEIGSRVKKMIF